MVFNGKGQGSGFSKDVKNSRPVTESQKAFESFSNGYFYLELAFYF